MDALFARRKGTKTTVMKSLQAVHESAFVVQHLPSSFRGPLHEKFQPGLSSTRVEFQLG